MCQPLRDFHNLRDTPLHISAGLRSSAEQKTFAVPAAPPPQRERYGYAGFVIPPHFVVRSIPNPAYANFAGGRAPFVPFSS
ncbi:MAG: hypothetical protein PHS38_11070 [Bacteroidales bacterium]|nr:hypothetical protein [Bacteroidales bacterium]